MYERLPVTLGDLAQAVCGRVVAGAAETPIDGFSIDSRSLSRGDLFVAIRGKRFDGHAFVTVAIGRGACGALVSDPAALGSSAMTMTATGVASRTRTNASTGCASNREATHTSANFAANSLTIKNLHGKRT